MNCTNCLYIFSELYRFNYFSIANTVENILTDEKDFFTVDFIGDYQCFADILKVIIVANSSKNPLHKGTDSKLFTKSVGANNCNGFLSVHIGI